MTVSKVMLNKFQTVNTVLSNTEQDETEKRQITIEPLLGGGVLATCSFHIFAACSFFLFSLLLF